MLSREEFKKILFMWYKAWEEHNLDGVIELFHDDAIFDNWEGVIIRGKGAIRRAWIPWFENHGGFRFKEEATFIDEIEQKVLYQWQLKWPSLEKDYIGIPETRRGVDIIAFKDGKIIKKLAYSKISIAINGEKIRLTT